VLLREIVAALEADADDLPPVAGVAPGVVAQPGVEPEMEILGDSGQSMISWNFWPTKNQGICLV
jgi:hypothetical protein